jgi:hypothetical protein
MQNKGSGGTVSSALTKHMKFDMKKKYICILKLLKHEKICNR